MVGYLLAGSRRPSAEAMPPTEVRGAGIPAATLGTPAPCRRGDAPLAVPGRIG